MVTQEMIDRVKDILANGPESDPHMIRKLVQEEFKKLDKHVTNNDLYFAILDCISPPVPPEPPTVEEIAVLRDQELAAVVITYQQGLEQIINKYNLPVTADYVKDDKLVAIETAIAGLKLLEEKSVYPTVEELGKMTMEELDGVIYKFALGISLKLLKEDKLAAILKAFNY